MDTRQFVVSLARDDGDRWRATYQLRQGDQPAGEAVSTLFEVAAEGIRWLVSEATALGLESFTIRNRLTHAILCEHYQRPERFEVFIDSTEDECERFTDAVVAGVCALAKLKLPRGEKDKALMRIERAAVEGDLPAIHRLLVRAGITAFRTRACPHGPPLDDYREDEPVPSADGCTIRLTFASRDDLQRFQTAHFGAEMVVAAEAE